MSPESKNRLLILRSAPADAWLALSGDESRLVAIGKDYSEVSAKADAAGEPDAVIVKTPPIWSSISL